MDLDRSLCPAGQPILVAVSGGADSIALWDLLAEHHPVTIWHLDHGLRPDSAADAQWVQARATRLRVPWISERIDLAAQAVVWGMGLEEAGRTHRYARLTAIASERAIHHVATGHHADDRAESIVMALLRGGGPGAWMGPRSQRPLGESTLIRPLLGIRRQTLRTWLSGRGESWREDASNQDERFTRNRTRRVIAEWESHAPGFVEALLAEADRRRASHLAVLAAVDRLDIDHGLPAQPLLSATPEILRTALALHLEQLEIVVDRERLRRLEDLLRGPPGREYRIGEHLWRRRKDGVRLVTSPDAGKRF